MNTYRSPVRRGVRLPADPTHYTRRRISSLLVLAGAVFGAVMATLLEASGAPATTAILVGVAVLLTATVVATNIPARRQGRGLIERLRDEAAASQLGPPPEMVIGRHTGARI